MNIKHYPLFNTEEVCEIYSKKDGVDVKYVCTTDLKVSDVPVDVFYRPTPHPQFGNRYFGLYYDHYRNSTMITNADLIEELEFGLVKNDVGEYEYSQSHHDYKKFKNGNMIDGGRQYIRCSNDVFVMRIVNGKFVPKTLETLNSMGDLKFTTAEDYVYPGNDCQV